MFKYKNIMLPCRRYNVEKMLNRFGAEGTRRAGNYDGNTRSTIAQLATRIECDTSTSDILNSLSDIMTA